MDDSKCTLRAAIKEINASSKLESICGVFDFANRVTLQPGTYKLRPLPLIVGRDDRDVCVHIEGMTDNEGRAPVIDGNAIEGKEGTSEDPAWYGVFSIRPRGRMSLDGVTIKNGHVHFPGGGAIWNEGGDVAIYNSLLTKNSTHGRGGAIYNKRGNLWINQSTLSDNWSKPNIDIDFDGDRNYDPVAGGAIANVGGSVLMYNVTVSGNRGGIGSRNDLDKDDPADDRNDLSSKGGGGGAIANLGGGVMGMNNTTVAYNLTDAQSRADDGGGIYNDKMSTVNIWNTIIANNYKKPKTSSNCRGTFGSFGYNIVDNQGIRCTVNQGPGDMVGGRPYIDPNTGREEYLRPIDPRLDILSQNGGPTPTHALLKASPAIDAGNPDPAGNGACAETDQRYLPRPKDGPTQDGYDGLAVCDIGAYEHGVPEISVGDVKLTEGNSGRKIMIFELLLSYPSVEPFSVYYWTADGSAKTTDSDYSPASGEALFGTPNHGRTNIDVEILGDRTQERNETLFFNIAPATGAVRFKDEQAVGTILNDDY